MKYYFLVDCEHVICYKCFNEQKRCPKCKVKIKKDKEGERNGKGKEYLKGTNILIFEGEYRNGKKHGKGEEY